MLSYEIQNEITLTHYYSVTMIDTKFNILFIYACHIPLSQPPYTSIIIKETHLSLDVNFYLYL